MALEPGNVASDKLDEQQAAEHPDERPKDDDDVAQRPRWLIPVAEQVGKRAGEVPHRRRRQEAVHMPVEVEVPAGDGQALHHGVSVSLFGDDTDYSRRFVGMEVDQSGGGGRLSSEVPR